MQKSSDDEQIFVCANNYAIYFLINTLIDQRYRYRYCFFIVICKDDNSISE